MPEQRIIIEDSSNENWETYQPFVSVLQFADYVQIRFTKKTADSVNIYKRQSAAESWEFIATAVNSPYDDHDSEEEWEYCIRGVKENREVGISAVVAATTKNNHSQ